MTRRYFNGVCLTKSRDMDALIHWTLKILWLAGIFPDSFGFSASQAKRSKFSLGLLISLVWFFFLGFHLYRDVNSMLIIGPNIRSLAFRISYWGVRCLKLGINFILRLYIILNHEKIRDLSRYLLAKNSLKTKTEGFLDKRAQKYMAGIMFGEVIAMSHELIRLYGVTQGLLLGIPRISAIGDHLAAVGNRLTVHGPLFLLYLFATLLCRRHGEVLSALSRAVSSSSSSLVPAGIMFGGNSVRSEIGSDGGTAFTQSEELDQLRKYSVQLQAYCAFLCDFVEHVGFLLILTSSLTMVDAVMAASFYVLTKHGNYYMYMLLSFEFLINLYVLTAVAHLGDTAKGQVDDNRERLGDMIAIFGVKRKTKLAKMCSCARKWEWNLTAVKLFRLNHSMLPGAFSALMTYLTFLFQIRISEKAPVLFLDYGNNPRNYGDNARNASTST